MKEIDMWEQTRRRWRGRLQGIRATRVGLSRARWHNAQRLLLAVLWFDQKGEGCWAGSAALSDEADLSRTTLGRAKRDAIDLGFLVVERRDSPSPYGGRLTDMLRINYVALKAYVDPDENKQGDDTQDAQPTEALPPAGDGEARGRPGDPGVQPDPPCAQPERYIEEETPELNSDNQPPPNPQREDIATDQPPAVWKVVEGELFQAGVNQAAAACRDARSAGLSPAEAHSLIDHWRPRQAAWGEHTHAVLRRRLQRARARQPPHEGWPPYAEHAPSAEAERADQQAAQAHRQRRKRMIEKAEKLLEQLGPNERAKLGGEVRATCEAVASPKLSGREVFERGVAPLLAEWGEEGLQRWIEEGFKVVKERYGEPKLNQ